MPPDSAECTHCVPHKPPVVSPFRHCPPSGCWLAVTRIWGLRDARCIREKGDDHDGYHSRIWRSPYAELQWKHPWTTRLIRRVLRGLDKLRDAPRPLGHLNLSLDIMPVIAASSSNETNCYVYLSSETDSRGIAAPSNTADPTPWPVQWTVPPHYENNETPRSSPLMAVTDCHRARIPVSNCLMLETILRSHALTITVLIMIFTGCRYFPLQPPCAFIIFMSLNFPTQPSAPRRQRIYHARGLTRGQQSWRSPRI